MLLRARPNVALYLLLALGGLSAVPVLALGNRLAARWEERVLRDDDAAAALEVEAARREILQIMGSRRAMLEVVGATAERVGLDRADVLQPIVDRQRERSDSFDTLYVADRAGVSVVAANAPGGRALVGISYADRDYYRELVSTGQPAFSRVQRGKMSGVANVHIAVPVLGAGGSVEGLVCAGVQLELLASAARTCAQGRGKARIVIVDEHGMLLIDTAGRLSALEPARGVASRSIDAAGTITVVGEDDTGESVRATGTAIEIGAHRWRAWSMTPVAQLAGEVEAVRVEALRITLASMAAALLASALAAWWVAGALRRLTRAAQRVGDGEFGLQLPAVSALAPREVADLREALAASLQRLDGNDRARRELLDRLGATTAAQRPLAEAWAQVGEGVAALDPEGRILFVNPAWERLTGLTAELLRGSPSGLFDDGLRASDDRAVGPEVRARVTAGEPWRGDLQTRDFRGEPAVHRVTLSPVLDAAGRLERIVAVRQDITEQVHAETRLRDTDRLASIGTLAAGVAHEINNPLTYITMNLDMVQESLAGGGPVDAADRGELLESLREARTGLGRVADIASSLLRLARKKRASTGPVSVAEVVRSCARIAANELRHRARFVDELAALPEVAAVESELSQIVLNLLLNAAQAIPPGASDRNAVTVRSGLEEGGRFAWLEVADTGSGIPRAVLGRIFDPFFTTKEVGKGTGLGLAVSHSLAQSMGGELSVRSEQGAGTTFRLRLPLAEAPAEAAPAAAAPALPPQRILVVDDTEEVGRSVAVLLRGHDVQVASSGAQALEHLGRRRFDVVVSDVMMPQMTGVELHARAVEHSPALAARWIFLTGGTLTLEIDEALARIGAPVVQKPVSRRDLLDAVAARVRAA